MSAAQAANCRAAAHRARPDRSSEAGEARHPRALRSGAASAAALRGRDRGSRAIGAAPRGRAGAGRRHRGRSADIAYRPRRQLVVQVERRQRLLRCASSTSTAARQKQFGGRGGRACARSARCARVFSARRWSIRATASCATDEPLPEALTPVYPTTAGLGAGGAAQADRAGAGARANSTTRCPPALLAHRGLPRFATPSTRCTSRRPARTRRRSTRARTRPGGA